MKLVTIIIVFSHFVFTLSYLESIPCQASTLYNAHDTLEHPLRAVVRDSSQSGACPQTTESPPPLEEALFSLKSINLCFLYLTYLTLTLFSTFATSLTVARYKYKYTYVYMYILKDSS